MNIMTAPAPASSDPLQTWIDRRPWSNRATIPIIKAVKAAFADKGYEDNEERLRLGRKLVGRPVSSYDDHLELLRQIEKLPANTQAALV